MDNPALTLALIFALCFATLALYFCTYSLLMNRWKKRELKAKMLALGTDRQEGWEGF